MNKLTKTYEDVVVAKDKSPSGRLSYKLQINKDLPIIRGRLLLYHLIWHISTSYAHDLRMTDS